MFNGGSSHHHQHTSRDQQHQQHQQHQHHNNSKQQAAAQRQAKGGLSALVRRALRFRSAADLACKVPLVVGAIAVLLVLNTVLQYAALHRAPPLTQHEGGRGRPGARLADMQQQQQQQGGAAHAAATGRGAAGAGHGVPAEGIAGDVAPGGADAELLCVDRQAACDTGHCSKVSVKYQDCKATCNGCEHLRASIQAGTGLQVRVVQQLSPCRDLHPSCGVWASGGKCSREAKAMLELCQASCGFCQPQAASPLAAAAAAVVAGGDGSSSSSSLQPSGLLDECQDDINVCPYLATAGLCSSGDLWVETQCQRSCGHCTPGTPAADAAGAGGVLTAAQQGSGVGPAATTAGASAAAAAAAAAGGAVPQAGRVVIPDKAFGSGRPSGLRVYGRALGAAAFTAQELEEWPVAGCRDNMDRCAAWARDGECTANPDFMAISCKASCGACASLRLRDPHPEVQLASGWAMPAVGLGTAGLGVGTAAAVEYAAAVGYRLFDTAESKDWYDEEAVGAGLAAAKVPRSSLFLVSKIHPRDLGAAATRAAFGRCLAHLRTSYLDLLLLHYPQCFLSANCIPSPGQTWQESWGVLEGLVAQGKVRSIGVSNFGLSEMQELLKLAKVPPSVLEARSDPFAANHHLIRLAAAHNITFVGYSSFGTQWINSPTSINPVFNSSLLQAVADRHPGKSLAQVVLRWALQKGQVVIPRSSSTEHIPENLQLFDFALTDGEMQAIDGLDGTWKTGGLPLPVA